MKKQIKRSVKSLSVLEAETVLQFIKDSEEQFRTIIDCDEACDVRIHLLELALKYSEDLVSQLKLQIGLCKHLRSLSFQGL